jgi:ribosomal-protein-alanine N-acetyltransferase
MTRWESFPLLDTERLYLREITYQDAVAIFKLFSDPRVAQYLDGLLLKDLHEAQDLIEELRVDGFEKNSSIRWGIILKDRNELIGTCGYHKWIKENAWRAEIGYDLIPEHWNKGLMTEALGEMVRFGFEVMGLNRIESPIEPEHLASIRVVEKLGFRLEGVLREHIHYGDRFHDDALYALLAKEWFSRKAKET